MIATITQTRTAAPAGIYAPTSVDAAKAAADFRMVAIVGAKTAIVWKDGRSETVTARKLAQLQVVHSSAADF
jgi:hypothetical protein